MYIVNNQNGLLLCVCYNGVNNFTNVLPFMYNKFLLILSSFLKKGKVIYLSIKQKRSPLKFS